MTEKTGRRRPLPCVRESDDRPLLVATPDDVLLGRARDGDTASFAELYRRHRSDAIRYARRLCRRHLDYDAADDVVAEAIRKVLTALQRGRGPRTGFRPYLFTAIRTVTLTESLAVRAQAIDADTPHPTVEVGDEHLEAHVAMRAFASLPQRWQRVLWATRVDQLPPTEAGPLLGMRPNSVAALAMRAREALRIAYVREHLPRPAHELCRQVIDLLARRAVVALGPTQSSAVGGHLDSCESCRDAVQLVEREVGNWARAVSVAAVTNLFQSRESDELAPADEAALLLHRVSMAGAAVAAGG